MSSEVITLNPYAGYISYDSDISKSSKEKSTLGGAYTSIGTLKYLVEFNYMYMSTQYKQDANISEDLVQHDIALAYAQYFDNVMLRAGGHYIETNDNLLGNGFVAILGIGGYNFFQADKLSYGLEFYYSFYENRLDEETLNQSLNAAPLFTKRAKQKPPSQPAQPSSGNQISNVSIIQITPYLAYFTSINPSMSNNLSIKLNYQLIDNYIQDQYLSFEMSDTFYYNNLFIILSAYGGEMRSGVKDRGMTVYNSLDLMKTGYGANLGYYITKGFTVGVSYSRNNYVEEFLTKDTTNNIALLNMNYRF